MENRPHLRYRIQHNLTDSSKIKGVYVSALGVVVIGRNEGDRLRRCLESFNPASLPVVYVDSGSTDGSRELAVSRGVEVVALDLSIPFTAARARNHGFARLLEMNPDLIFVQFMDGDCEVAPGWLDSAAAFLEANPTFAVACGRRRERYPEKSVYNRLCDIEWETPVGETRSCGGDALMRVQAVKRVGGYDPSVIAAEDDEICVRLRQAGWKIQRLDAEMATHDAAITSVRQWWKRSVRTGYAYSLGAYMHGRPPERHFIRERRRFWLWGFLLPFAALAAAWPTYGLSLLAFLLYPLQAWRIYRRTRKTRDVPKRDAMAYGVACIASKIPEFFGFCRFTLTRWRGRRGRIIEYK